MTVNGSALSSTTSVRFGELSAAFTVTSATQLAVTVPRLATNQKIRVTTPAGSALSATAFAVTHPSNSNLYPAVTTAFSGVNVGFYSAPAFTDLDGDRKLDLLIGSVDGVINHYEQDAVNGQTFSFVDAPFNNIAVGSNAKPTVTDLDGDGLLDLLIGDFDGNINHYEQSALNSLTFNLVTATFNAINVGTDAAPAFTDLDGDGLLDLLIGEADGNLNHYEQNAANSLAFTLRTANFNSITIGFSSAPTVTDLDADGLLDLLVGEEDGNLNHYEQTAANATTFTLITTTFYSIDVGDRSIPVVTDIDSDGLVDVVVGELNGGLFRFEQADPPTALALSNSTLPENVPANTAVGTFSTTDLTPGDVFIYTLVAGTGSTDNGAFTITNASGVGTLRIRASPNFEVKNSYTVRVRTTDATGLTFEQAFVITITDVPPPTITNISPTQGGVGSSVTITGTNLYGTTPVTFTGTTGNTVTTGYTVNAGGTQITGIIVPTGAQTGTIRVNTPEGSATSTQTFTVCRPVAITKNITVQLSANGTASITAAMVNNGSTANCGFAAGGGLSVSPSTFTCANVGNNTVTLTVTDASGATKTAPATVTITAPPTATLTSLTPNPAAPGATVTAVGTNLSGANGLTVNGAPATINGLSATGFTFVVPAGAAASGNVVLSLPCNQNLSLPFSVTQPSQPPTITNISPTSGPVGTSVTITGTNLGGTSVVTFTGTTGNTVTTGYTVNAGGTQITGIVVPNGAQTGTISLTTGAGSATSTQTFTVCRPVAIAKNISVQLSANGTASITAAMVNNGSTANCGFAAGGGLSVSPSSFTCANVGNNTVTLTVTDAAGATSTATANVTVTTPPAATLTSLSPSSGSVGQTITASGTNLSGATGLTVNGAAATISNLTATGFTFVVPAGASNAGNVVVTLPCNQTRSIAFSVCRPQAIAQNVSVELGADGTANVTPAAVNNGSTANCGFAAGGGLSVSPSTFTCANLGNNAVTLTVTDAAGNTSTAPATVTVTLPSTVTTTTWNGSVSTDWNDCRNWSFGKVPNATTNAVIPVVASGRYPSLSAGTYNVQNQTMASGTSLTLGAPATLRVSGDWTNDNGPLNLAGTVAFVGSGPIQILGGTAVTDFGMLLVNKPSGNVQLAQNVMIGEDLTLTTGLLITTDAYRVTLSSAAAITESETSYVTGTVATTRLVMEGVSETFGGIGLTLTPAAGSTSPGLTDVVRVTGKAVSGSGIGTSVLRYFDIRPATTTGLNVTMVFMYFDHELNTVATNNLALYKSASSPMGPWVKQQAVTFGPNSVTKTGITSFSFWTVGNADVPLPVELVTFTAERQGSVVATAWRTASEQDNAGFVIERSVDGHSFVDASAMIAGHGTTTQANAYTWRDKAAPASVLYYRLRQVDTNGAVATSSIVAVQAGAAGATGAALSLYPNPAQLSVTLLNLPANESVTLRDATGRTVRTLVPTGPTAQLSLQGLPVGMYTVHAGTQTQRLVVE